MVRPFIFPALTIWGTRGTLVLRLSGRQPFSLHRPGGVYEPRKRVRS